MNAKQWDILLKSAAMEVMEKIPIAYLVDSVWIPGYCGISHHDYFTMPDKWYQANLMIKKDFPEVIFIPDFWVEYGMAFETTGFGCKINFYENSTPTLNHLITSIDDIDRLINLSVPNPKTDGLMPFALNIYKNMEPKIKGMGESIKIVAARGPLTIAAHLMGVTEFLLGVKLEPDNIHKLLKNTATLTKNWLSAQVEVLSEVEGILVLDDVVGFLSKDDYLQFAHPYLKEINGHFPGFLKLYHNDTDNPISFEFLKELGTNIFNFTHKQDLAKVKGLAGDKVCLMGNVPPLDTLFKGTPEQVVEATKKCLLQYSEKKGLLVSAGGGVSFGTSKQNLRAMIDTAMKQ